MQGDRQVKYAEMLRGFATEQIARESNRDALITVTRVDVSPDLKNATVFYTVLPESKKAAVDGFMLRQRKHIRNYIKKNAHTRSIPYIEVEYDLGEKNRQRLDELSKEANRLEN
ncbi:ribosome-binding factor A [Candidatus Parcubacteria bacterium]|nr:ribosome-binding factor A [Candidatus Parcubacteria bacterium]